MRDAIVRAGHENHLEWLREQSRWSGRGGAIEERDGLLLHACSTDFPVSFNGVVRTDPEVAPTEVIERSDSWFGQLGRGYSVTTSDLDGVDDDLQAACASAGLHLLGEPPEMVLLAPIDPPRPVDGVELEWVDDAGGVADFLAVCAGAYGTIGMPAGVVEAAITDVERFTAPWVHTVVARRDGEPLAAAQVLLSHGIAGIYWVGTLAAARGSGLGETVTRAAAGRAFGLGAVAVTLQASEQGEPIYRRLGFESVYRYHRWVRFEAPGR